MIFFDKAAGIFSAGFAAYRTEGFSFLSFRELPESILATSAYLFDQCGPEGRWWRQPFPHGDSIVRADIDTQTATSAMFWRDGKDGFLV